jgi:hypothetical protein
MKLSKKLLQAMTMGLAIGATVTTSSCTALGGDVNILPVAEDDKCTEKCDTNCKHSKNVFTAEDCPACGLG